MLDEEPTPSAQMPSFSLKSFGVGDGWPSEDRNHSSFLYQVGKTSLLIDCGEPISRLYKASGLNYDTIDQIFLSHLHFDHVGGFFMLIQGFWLEQRQKDLVVHLPQDGIDPIRNMLNAACLFDDLFSFRLRFEPLKSGSPILINKVKVTPFRTTHLDSLRRAFQHKHPQKYEAFCFLMESNGLRIGHSADIGAPEDLDPLLEQPLDLLVCELAHARPEHLFRYLRNRSVGHIVFTHLSRRLWESLEEISALASESLGSIPFSFAQDGGTLRPH